MKSLKIYSITAICTLAMFALMSCGSGGLKYYIDNPTDQAITVTIDGKDPIKLEPFEFKIMEKTISEGKHTLQLNDGAAVDIEVADYRTILNPTQATYVAIKQEYGSGINSSVKDTAVVIDGEEYTGPIAWTSKDLAISLKGISYILGEPFPDEVETTSTARTVVREKIFRKKEFLEYFDIE